MTAKYAFKQSVPIMAGYIVLGMGFGVLLESKGYGVLWAIAMSMFIYAGIYAVCCHKSDHWRSIFDRHCADDADGKCETFVLWNFHAE